MTESLAVTTKDMLEHIAVHSLMFSVQSADKNYSVLLFLLLLFSRSHPPCSQKNIENFCCILTELCPIPDEFLYVHSRESDAFELQIFGGMPLTTQTWVWGRELGLPPLSHLPFSFWLKWVFFILEQNTEGEFQYQHLRAPRQQLQILANIFP